MHKPIKSIDLSELIRPSKGGPSFMHEQEINFDAGYTPSEKPLKFIREERIDGQLYNVYQAWATEWVGGACIAKISV